MMHPMNDTGENQDKKGREFLGTDILKKLNETPAGSTSCKALHPITLSSASPPSKFSSYDDGPGIESPYFRKV